MGIPINDLIYLLGRVIQLGLNSKSEDLFIGSFQVKAIQKNEEGEILISGFDGEGLHRYIPLKNIAEYRLMN